MNENKGKARRKETTGRRLAILFWDVMLSRNWMMGWIQPFRRQQIGVILVNTLDSSIYKCYLDFRYSSSQISSYTRSAQAILWSNIPAVQFLVI